MVRIKGLIDALSTTDNFWIILPLKFSKNKYKVRFKNGSELKLNWTDYCNVRDFFTRKDHVDCVLVQNGQMFKVKGHGVSLSAPIEKVSSIVYDIKGLRSTGYTITQQSGLHMVEGHGIKIASDLDTLPMVREILGDLAYECDCQNKIVLDVGAFHGESAVFFFMKGAKKVILYEPVKKHLHFIEENILANKVNADINMVGIGDLDGEVSIFYDRTDFQFGIANKGQNQMLIQTKNVSDVIRNSHANIAKFDCEGAEQTLVNVASNILKMIDLYIIEIHTKEIRAQLFQKFSEAGFAIIKDTIYSEHISVVFFKKS